MRDHGQRQTIMRSILAAMLLAACPCLWCSDDSTTRILGSLDVPITLSPAWAALIDIDNCRATLPASDAKQRFTQIEESLIEGLLIGWDPNNPNISARAHTSLQLAAAERSGSNGWKWPDTAPPDIYLKSLANDAKVCKAAALHLNDSPAAQAALTGVINDLALKAQDCILHGMGRTITFRVKTMRGQAADRGWTVYFKWLTVSNLETQEMAFPKTSTPAFNDLPPGLYRIRAEKRDPATAAIAQSEVKMCQVDGAHQECEVQVP
ncbi:MAG TPA: hypothetical protein VHD85_12220 [Terracidiphilus sp.]|nr:hypothetical protein [Terracidiphilus sp.]